MRGEVWETAERFIDALKNPNSELSCLAEPDLDEKLSALKAESINRGNEKEANLVWCAQSIAEVQRHFIGAFSKLKDGKFYDAWCEFERCEISLSSLLEHFSTDEPDSHGLLYIQRMVERWQSLYPYKMFLSPELLKKIIVCSICGGRITPRANCGHKKGDLYNGEICHHIIESAELISISLVEQPVQRYSVAFLSNEDGTQRDHYDYGNVKFVVDRVASPFHEWHPERTRRIVTAAELAHVSIDHPCPCLSGKLFGECCSNMPEVDIPHLQISFFVPPPRELPTLELLV